MQNIIQTLEFDKITKHLEDCCLTEHAKQLAQNLSPCLDESKVAVNLRETTQARQFLDVIGTPPFMSLDQVAALVACACQGGMLMPEQLDYLGTVLVSVGRLKSFLGRGKEFGNSLAYYADDLLLSTDLLANLRNCIRGDAIDDDASSRLHSLRRMISAGEEKLRAKADSLLKSYKNYCSDSFLVNRNGRICLPVKKEHKLKVPGSVIDQSSTKATLFIEPSAVAKLSEELQLLKLDEENEERRILYSLSSMVAGEEETFLQNIRVIERLDFIFAKGKLSARQDAKAPSINTDRLIRIVKGRHPLISPHDCVPLDFTVGKGVHGVIITGPNTGGKTVAIKTVGLLSLMAQCGLHIPCEEADICLNSQILCDIGDGQNITENLSTFSAHITNVLAILRTVSGESLVILDELGSGTDPAEGMGIAVAVLDELLKSGCLFLVTTHYPEIKQYAEKVTGIQNARMMFDRETLRPLYRMEQGKAGESCALHIARRLGMPESMLERAASAVYGDQDPAGPVGHPAGSPCANSLPAPHGPRIIKAKSPRTSGQGQEPAFQTGDSVKVLPDNQTAIVCRPADEKGQVLVQVKKKKILINQKRLKLLVSAKELYPDDYDFSIIFDDVSVRKARHQMGRHHSPGVEIHLEEI